MSLGTFTVLTLPGDNGTWSVTLVTSAGDTPLRSLRDPAAWSRVVGACPLQAHWLAGEPITDVLTMSGIVDRCRRFVVEGTAIATGLVTAADAWACTDPSAGRGLTVGFKHAVRLRDVLRQHPDDPAALTAAFDAVTEAEIAPWYHAQIATDRFRFAESEALRNGAEAPQPLTRECVSLFAVMAADPDLYRVGMSYVATITSVQGVFRQPDLVRRIGAALQALKEREPLAVPGPDRQRLLDLVA